MHDPHDHHPGPVHPADRPVEPEHPLSLEGDVVAGDTAFMFQCLVEELLLSGLDAAELRRMAGDDQYQSLAAARRALGEQRVHQVIDATAARMGVLRCTVWESTDDFRPAALTISAPGARSAPAAS